jgi:hypothetical protein
MSSTIKRIAFSALLLLLWGRVSKAQIDQRGQGDSPTVAVQSFMSALERNSWSEAAGLVDPEALADFHDRHVSVMRQVANTFGGLSVADLPPEMLAPASVAKDTVPRASDVAERMQLELRRMTDPREHGFARVANLREMEALAPAELFARWLEAHYSHSPKEARTRPQPGGRIQIVGEVLETKNIAHVVYRVLGRARKPGELDSTHSIVVSRTSQGWRVIPNGDLLREASSVRVVEH